tara:strand:- start:138 stop:872 length:735 start_codon:yes stop_codon:yes gene_type:complete
MKPLPADQLYHLHDSLTLLMIGVSLIIIYLGIMLKNNRYKLYISYGLIGFAVIQELIDYINRIFLDELYNFKLSTDLPLQFCVIGFYFSLFGIYMTVSKKKFNPKLEQFIFDCAYVLGFSGALQGLITVDLTGINNMIGSFALNWAHSLIILNVLWLIFAYNKRFHLRGIINTFLFINIIIIPVGFINYMLDANYMFICQPPNVQSSFIIGDWPYYLFYLEGIYLIYIFVLYLPFWIAEKIQKR